MSKKKETVDELLEEVLLPEDGQTHEVPENWVWVKSEFVAKWGSGGTPSRKNSEYYNGNIPWLKTGELRDTVILDSEEKITEEGLKKSSAKLFPKDSVAIAMYGATIGKLGILGIDAATNQACAVGVPYALTDKKFMFYYFLTQRKNLINRGKGGAQPNISQTIIKEFPYILPPINEQKRIVDKIEHLLNKIEEAKQLIEEAKKTFELRRAAILDKAFCGELTRKWREENSLEKKEVELINGSQSIESNSPYSIPTTWKWRKLKDVASFKNGFAFKSKDFVEQGIQLVRMGNLYKNDLALDRNPVYMPLDFDEKIIEKYSVKNGDILLSLTGTKYKRDYGYAVRVEGVEKPLLLNQRILSLNPNFMDEYIFYYLQSSVFRDVFFSFETGGVNQGNVGSKAVESILIPIPPLEEAKEIEKMLNNLLKNEKETLKILNVEDKLETLKQATLSKAFRGELGTNDPREENAIELLKEVLQEQVK
ncbi:MULTISPECIES: restriction endonuclease subunit S [Bacillus amyloliquefaciens group]|uniref:restriction endonuclease subunit S n=1 Tax=Bacillus amyloliquefaciens group TaxID=1938374 RepID=UPI0013F5F915|nr:restriction endonuclease subunit S [Bacillus velezensis]MEC2213577.1 restriction endonuclease subunit S [Bacillus velezensis]